MREERSAWTASVFRRDGRGAVRSSADASASAAGSSSSDGLTDNQLIAISIIERVGSVFSLLGCIFIIVTFCSSKAFHKPINRLVFYASFGNMMTNVGTLMAREYIPMPDSVGCQLQSFLIQM